MYLCMDNAGLGFLNDYFMVARSRFKNRNFCILLARDLFN